MSILSVNPGSSSKKYALYRDSEQVVTAHFEPEGNEHVLSLSVEGVKQQRPVTKKEYSEATAYLVALLEKEQVISKENPLSAVGIRVVASGSFFLEDREIDAAYLEKLKEAAIRAPLHTLPLIHEIEHLMKTFPKVPIIGVSDSAFHKSIPPHFRNYALPAETVERHDIRRFGYHGISVASVLRKLSGEMHELPSRIIVAHLGSGASLTAVKHGQSVANTMGFTPLDGLPMATRVGQVDPGVIVHLAKHAGMDPDELENYLFKQSGLRGVSGKTGDMRELLTLESSGDDAAHLAIEMFVYRAKQYLGAYAAALNGLDLLIFTATIGERSEVIRSRICENLDYLGIRLDLAKNSKLFAEDGFIQDKSSQVQVAVVTTDEMGQICRQAKVQKAN